jgi:hypothetical protein
MAQDDQRDVLDYAKPPQEALPPVPPRVWWTRLIVLSIFGLFALLGFGLLARLVYELFT